MSDPDVAKERWQHDQGLAYDPSLPKEFDATLVGWLKREVPRVGEISPDALRKIEWICEHRKIDQGWLGYHTCEICEQYDDRGEALYICDGVYYVIPQMILHYINDHGYVPPPQFMKALEKLDVGDTEDRRRS